MYSASISSHEGTDSPVESRSRSESRARLITGSIDGDDLDVQCQDVTQRSQQLVLVDRLARDVVETAELGMLGDQPAEDAGQGTGCEPGEDRAGEAIDPPAVLRGEPLKQTGRALRAPSR